jgi:hypothetical protein
MDRDAVRTLPFWRRRAAAAAAVAILAAAPFAIFHATIQDAATDFRLELGYLVSGWGPWLLIVVGSLCFVPVVVSLGRSAFSRWSLAPGIRLAYEIWGAVLYLLGLGLLVQTAQVAAVF